MTKRALKDPVTGLFPNEEAFARACVMHNQSEAYRVSQPIAVIKRLTNEQIHNRANKMASKPEVAARMREHLDAAKISDLDTAGRAFTDLARMIFKAEEAKNWTACAALMRLRLQVLGMLKETVLLNMEQTITDEELVKRVAGTNPALATALKASLGKEERYAA